MTLTANPRRFVQMLWVVAGLLFTIALLHTSPAGDHAKAWMSDKVGQFLPPDTGRLAMKEHMMLAEASWAKTVKQRHEMISADYKDLSELPLLVHLPALHTPWPTPTDLSLTASHLSTMTPTMPIPTPFGTSLLRRTDVPTR